MQFTFRVTVPDEVVPSISAHCEAVGKPPEQWYAAGIQRMVAEATANKPTATLQALMAAEAKKRDEWEAAQDATRKAISEQTVTVEVVA